MRAIAYVSGGEVRLVSRHDKDMAASYPELAVLAGRAGAPVILDGEIVALRAGRPDFGALQSRMHVRRPPARLIDGTPVQLYLFDLLHHGPDSLLGLSQDLAAVLVAGWAIPGWVPVNAGAAVGSTCSARSAPARGQTTLGPARPGVALTGQESGRMGPLPRRAEGVSLRESGSVPPGERCMTGGAG